MKALMYTRRALFLVAAILAALVMSCSDTDAGIFSRVQAEKSTTESMTEAIQDATPSFVVRLGSTYYAGIGTLWTKSDGAKWTSIAQSALTEIKETSSLDTQDSPLFASSGVVIGSELYVLFSDSGTGEGVGVWSTTDASTWSRVDSAFPASGSYLRVILAANEQLFAVTAVVASDLSETYSIHHYNGANFVAASGFDGATVGMPNSVAYGNSAYCFTAGDAILTGSESALNVLTTEPTGGSAYSGVCSVGTGILVSNRLGYLYYSSDDGANWINTTSAFSSSASKVYSFSTPTYFIVDGKKTLLVGTNKIPRAGVTPSANGYLDFDLTDPFAEAIQPQSGDTALSTAINFASSLSGVSVNAMPFFDLGTTKKVFALTDGDGLWSNAYSGTTWGGWVRE